MISPYINYEKNGHRITVEEMKSHLQVIKDGHIIADTFDPLLLKEDGHTPVYYIPLKDVKDVLVASSTHSVCPYKGRASYYSITTASGILEDKVWQYSEPTKEFVKQSSFQYLSFSI
jgi:uncharacterized protein (DUF427 family)